MLYAILNYESEAQLARGEDPAQRDAYMGAYFAYIQALEKAGVIRGGQGLKHPSTATTVSIRDGKRRVQDGPVADTKEMLAGFFVIEAPTLDAALEWAAKCPAAIHGRVEVRPTLPAAD